MERFLNWLAYDSGVLTERFQAMHLIVNYSFLALMLGIYLLVDTTAVILLGCLPGALVFLVSFEALAWKMAVEDKSPWSMMLPLR